MTEIKKEKQIIIKHFLNMVYVNYLSTLCIFIYLPLYTKAVGNKLQTGPAGSFKALKFRNVNLFLRVNIAC